MNPDDVEAALRDIAGPIFGMNPFEALLMDLPIDTIECETVDLLELTIAAEEEFGVELDDDLLAQCETLRRFADVILEKMDM